MLRVLIAIGVVCAVLGQSYPAATAEVQSNKPLSLPDVVRATMQFYFDPPASGAGSLEQFIKTLPVSAQYSKPSGVFVTLSKNGKSRACWGSLTPERSSLVASTVYATIGALTKDYRYKKIRAGEWRGLKPQVTVVKSVEPIESISGQNPMLNGLLVRSGGKTGLLLPREAKDAYYQLVQCKLKAGIHKSDPYQLYRIRAQIYE